MSLPNGRHDGAHGNQYCALQKRGSKITRPAVGRVKPSPDLHKNVCPKSQNYPTLFLILGFWLGGFLSILFSI